MALQRRNEKGTEASEMPGAPIKVEVVEYWPNVEKEVQEWGHVERNKCLAAMPVTKRKEM